MQSVRLKMRADVLRLVVVASTVAVGKHRHRLVVVRLPVNLTK